MGKTAILSVRIIGDALGGVGALNSVDRAAANLERTMARVRTAVALVLTAIVGLGIGAVGAASDLQQSTGAYQAVFAQYSDTIEQSSEVSANAVGLAKDQYQQLASVLGSQLKNMGISIEEASGKTVDLIKLGADLSAMYGGTASDAVAALSSLLRGERDPIERYGVSIKQADIEAQKAAMGLAGLTGEAAKNADLQATLALLYAQTGDAAGTFADEADTASGAQQRANAAWRDAQAALGEALLPLVSQGAYALRDFANWVDDNHTLVLGLAIGLGVLAVSLGVLTAAQWAFNIAATANPIGLVILAIVLAIGALIAIVAVVITYWDQIVAVGADAWAKVQQFVIDAATPVVGFINLIIDAINWMAKLSSGQLVLNALGAQVNYTPQLKPVSVQFNGKQPTSTTVNNTYNTTVNGAIDKAGTARTVTSVLNAQGRTTGATSVAGAVVG